MGNQPDTSLTMSINFSSFHRLFRHQRRHRTERSHRFKSGANLKKNPKNHQNSENDSCIKRHEQQFPSETESQSRAIEHDGTRRTKAASFFCFSATTGHRRLLIN